MMRYTSGDLCINWSEDHSALETVEARGSIVTKQGELVWRFYGIHYPSSWTPKRVAQEILDWAAVAFPDTIHALADVDNTYANETRFAVKEAA